MRKVNGMVIGTFVVILGGVLIFLQAQTPIPGSQISDPHKLREMQESQAEKAPISSQGTNYITPKIDPDANVPSVEDVKGAASSQSGVMSKAPDTNVPPGEKFKTKPLDDTTPQTQWW